MNATKRKFNALIQGIGNKSSDSSSTSISNRPVDPTGANAASSTTSLAATSSNTSQPSGETKMTVNEDLIAKRRRLQALTEKNAITRSIGTIKAVGGGGATRVSNVVLKKSTPSGNNLKSTAEAQAAPAKYAPSDRNDLLKRLGTFSEITDWTPKPDRLNEIEWAKRGWVCMGKERVRCMLCHKELLVKLTKKAATKENAEKDDDASEAGSTAAAQEPSAELMEAVEDKYAELIVTAHQEECLWRRGGCDDSLLRLSLTNAKQSYEALRHRYDELCQRKSFLPYDFNLRLPDDLDIDAVVEQLPEDFFKTPEPTKNMQHPNKVALALALTGWQGLSNPRIGAVPNSASCHTCLRRLGLWMFKSKEVGENNEILVSAPMDHLDPTREHRFFCPWKNPATQRWSSAKPVTDSDLPAWKIQLQVIKNDAYLRGALNDRPKKKDKATKGHTPTPSTPVRPTAPGTPDTRGNVSMDTPSIALTVDGDDDDEDVRSVKDKERWARLRRVKSLFESKGARKLRRTLSRPGTSHSQASAKSVATGNAEKES